MTIRSCEISDTLLAELRAYLAKQSDEEAARLNAALGSLATEVLRVRDLVIDPRRHEVTRGGNPVELTAKEFEILYFLASNRGQVFTKEEIYTAVWAGKYYLDDSNIMSFIRKLRKKLEPDPDDPVYILTIWGVGYKFAET